MSANGVFTSTIDYTLFGGGYSVLVGGASGTFDVSFASDVVVPVVATSTNSLDFTLTAGVETPTIYATASGSLDFSMNQSGFIVFGIQSYLYSGNNEINFAASSTGIAPIVGVSNGLFPITISGTMAQFSLGQTTGAFAFAVQSKGMNYTLLNKSRPNLTNGIRLTDAQVNNVNIKMEPNGVKIRDNGSNYVQIR